MIYKHNDFQQLICVFENGLVLASLFLAQLTIVIQYEDVTCIFSDKNDLYYAIWEWLDEVWIGIAW